jgi:hypothetical protein
MEARLNKKKFQTALEDDLADELNGVTNALPTTRSLLDISADELAARVIVDGLVYSKQFRNSTGNILIFDSNATNATFTVREAVAALEAIVSDPDSRLRSKGFVQADSIQSISNASVPLGDLVLCADGIKRESCPSEVDEDSLLDSEVATGVVGAAAVCVVVMVVVVLVFSVLRGRKQRTSSKGTHDDTIPDDPLAVDLDEFELDGTIPPAIAGAHPIPDDPPAVDLGEFELDPVVVKSHTQA